MSQSALRQHSVAFKQHQHCINFTTMQEMLKELFSVLAVLLGVSPGH